MTAGPAPEDYARIPGTAMRYKNRITGQEISRRSFENIRARQAGFRSYGELQKISKAGGPSPRSLEIITRSGLYAAWVRVWSDTHKEPIDVLVRGNLSPNFDTAEGREWAKLLRDAIEAGEWEPGSATENNGEAEHMEEIMQFIGLRDQNALERVSVGTYDYPIEAGRRRLRK